jgi:hypothetical protein
MVLVSLSAAFKATGGIDRRLEDTDDSTGRLDFLAAGTRWRQKPGRTCLRIGRLAFGS